MALSFRKKNHARDRREPLEVAEVSPEQGLTTAQAQERIRLGYVNAPVDPPGKTAGQIIASNVFTYFNLIFFVLAGFTIAVRSWFNLSFMGVVLVNMVIGIVQELRSKKVIDKLTLLNSPRCAVIREGQEVEINTEYLVRDDVVRFRSGDQVSADATVLSGECQVNEALVTGEADEIKKCPGDALLSGSFLVSGSCLARLTAVGADSYANRLTQEAKGGRRKKQSEMMRSLSTLVKVIGLLIIPLGLLLCYKEIHWLGRSFPEGVVSTIGALVGMIPEGLYLLTSLALVASVLRLAQKKTLVHELSCIETLARVDTVCVDKTGTVTENKMIVDSVHSLCPDRYTEDDVGLVMSDYVAAMKDDNDTMAALRNFFRGQAQNEAIAALPFTSAKKYGGVSFHEDETWLLGAPEVILGRRFGEIEETVERFSSKGCRVLLLANYDGLLSDPELNAPILPVALILLNNKIRGEAPETFRYFASQGVTVKVISGDNPVTVSEVARRAGIQGAESYVDARTLDTEEKIAEAAEKYIVFGRVTPDQKRKLVLALKQKKHTVAMTGDGVNDVLALKEADCSIAMASGSDAASRVSDIVLLDNNFAVMPSVVGEGRRVINNIQRSATLFLIKNIFSFALAIVSLIFVMPYPFSAAQLSLVSSLTIGFPAFVLAMEPNENRIQGRFLSNVLYRAVPPAAVDFALAIGVLLFYYAFQLDTGKMSTICAITMGIVGILVIVRLCRPFTKIRKALVTFICAAFVFSVLFLKPLFTLSPLDFPGRLITAVFALLAWPALNLSYRAWSSLTEAVKGLWDRRREKKTQESSSP